LRRTLESALPITIGDDCWIGGNTVICPGITIGNGCVIGAGSVVTKDIPTSLAVVILQNSATEYLEIAKQNLLYLPLHLIK
jgi:tetrahydrodipicolinate N-succinyltransferase